MAFQMTLHVIADSSGSMQEMGKGCLARNLVTFIRELLAGERGEPLGEIALYHWKERVVAVPMQEEVETPPLDPGDPGGRASLERLREFLQSELRNRNEVRAVILTDGNFQRQELKEFALWRKEQAGLALLTLAVGSDASYPSLQELSTGGRVYAPEDVCAALRSFLADRPLVVPRPCSASELVVPSRCREARR